MDVKSLTKRYGQLVAKRQNFNNLLQEVADYVQPDRGGFSGPLVRGAKRRQKIYDSTATQANELFAAFVHAMMSNPSTRWFDVVVSPTDLNEEQGVKEWLGDVGKVLNTALQNAKSNFATALHEVYLDLGLFGTSCLFVGDEPGYGLCFKAIPVAEIYIAEGYNGRIDTVFRSFTMTAQQMVSKWGSAVSDQTAKLAEEDPDHDVKILHAVMPRAQYEYGKVGDKHLPIASYYIELEQEHLILESGFRELPYLVARLAKSPGEIYGRSPAMTALADIKMINAMAKANIRGTQKLIDPPILVPSDGFITKGGLGPGDIAYYDSSIDGPDKIRALTSSARPDVALDVMSDVRERIRAAYYVDQLSLNVNEQMTATEVLARGEEKMRLMAPMLGRLHHELLEPMIQRVFNIMVLAGHIPPFPYEGVVPSIRAVYTSPIARAQQMLDSNAMVGMLAQVQDLITHDASVLMNVDIDKAFRGIAERQGVPADWLKDPLDVQQERQALQLQGEVEAAKNDLERLGKVAPDMAKKALKSLEDGVA